MTAAVPVDLQEAQAALATTVPRLTALIRSVRRPSTHAVGAWNAGEVAVHLAHGWEVLPALAREERDSPITEVSELATLTQSLVREEPDADMHGVADRIDAAAAAFFAGLAARSSDATGPWLVAGLRATPATFTCHLLNEALVHGYDIAHAQGSPWTIEPAHAAIALLGFVFPQLGELDPRAMVVQENAAGLCARYEIRIRRSGRVVLSFDDGALTVEQPSDQRIDVHLSADASALFLVLWGRQSQWPAVMSGKLIGWGRRPWLALRLRSLVRNP